MSPQDIELVKGCLRAAVEGPFFPDWEFSILFGLSRDEVKDIYISWPHIEAPVQDVRIAVLSAINNLSGYPHNEPDELKSYTGLDSEQLSASFERIRSSLR